MSPHEEAAVAEAVVAYRRVRAWIDAPEAIKRGAYPYPTPDTILAKHGIRFPSPAWRRCESEIHARVGSLAPAQSPSRQLNRTRRPLSEEDRRRIADLHLSGEKPEAIALVVLRNPTHVRRIIREMGLWKRRA